MKKNDQSEKTTQMGRRKAVKTIVGGVTALSAFTLLPAGWKKPVVQIGALPAHAATSSSVTRYYRGTITLLNAISVERAFCISIVNGQQVLAFYLPNGENGTGTVSTGVEIPVPILSGKFVITLDVVRDESIDITVRFLDNSSVEHGAGIGTLVQFPGPCGVVP